LRVRLCGCVVARVCMGVRLVVYVATACGCQCADECVSANLDCVSVWVRRCLDASLNVCVCARLYMSDYDSPLWGLVVRLSLRRSLNLQASVRVCGGVCVEVPVVPAPKCPCHCLPVYLRASACVAGVLVAWRNDERLVCLL